MAEKATSTGQRVRLPGFGIPLGTSPEWANNMFPNALSFRVECVKSAADGIECNVANGY